MDAQIFALVVSPVGLAILGLCIGSFLNVVIYRKPVMLEREWLDGTARYLQDADAMQRALGKESRQVVALGKAGALLQTELTGLAPLRLSSPRSRCGHCGHELAWHENIPVLGWLRLGGKCSACKSPISVRYPLIEAMTAALFFAVAWRFGATAASVVYCISVALLIAMAFIDLDTTLLPDELTLPLIGLGVLAAWMGWTRVPLADAALGVLFGYFSLWAIARLYKLLRHVDGMAEGDFKLLAGLGGLLGWQALPSVILLSSAVGAAVGIFMIVARGHNRNVPIPFGPYLAGGGLAALFFGADLSRLWLGA
jgi:leader peptidase (prepilin peptidase) / N-methyltransferase